MARGYMQKRLNKKMTELSEEVELTIKRLVKFGELCKEPVMIDAGLLPRQILDQYSTKMLKLEDISVRLLTDVYLAIEQSTTLLQELQKEGFQLSNDHCASKEKEHLILTSFGDEDGTVLNKHIGEPNKKENVIQPSPSPLDTTKVIHQSIPPIITQPLPANKSDATIPPNGNLSQQQLALKAAAKIKQRQIDVAGGEKETYKLEKYESAVNKHLGYSPDPVDPKVCRFYNRGACKQGTQCQWKHTYVQKDNLLEKIESVAYNTTSNDYQQNKYYLTRIVGYEEWLAHVMLLDPQPLNKTTLKALMQKEEASVVAESAHLRSYSLMLSSLTKEYQNKPTEPATIFPAIGSLVALPEDEEAKRYERARIIDVDIEAGKVTLKHLESGVVQCVSRRVIFSLTEEFAILPPLVEEFILSTCSLSYLNSINEDKLISQTFFAKIVDFGPQGEPVAIFRPFNGPDDVVRILQQIGD